MPRFIDRITGDEVIGASSRVSGGVVYEPRMPKTSDIEEHGLPYGEISRGAFARPDTTSFMRGLDIIHSRLAEIRNDTATLKKEILAQDILDVNQATEAMSLHIEEFKRQYLLDHPDGRGLTSAVRDEMKNTFGSYFSGNDVVDSFGTLITQGKILQNEELRNAVMPGLQKYGTSVLIDAEREESKQNLIYTSTKASDLLDSIRQKIGGENVDIVQYHMYKGQFDNIIEYLKATTGEANALKIKQKWESEINVEFGKGLIRQSPALFLQLKQSGELDNIMSPTELSYLSEIAGDELAQIQRRQLKENTMRQKAQMETGSLALRMKLFNELEADPFKYTANQIQQMQLTQQDLKLVLGYQQSQIKYYDDLDIVKSNVQREINIGQGVGHLSEEEQQIAIDECGVVNSKGISHPVDQARIANSVGSTYENKALANKYLFDMCATNNPTELKSYFDGFKEAILTKNNIFGKEIFGKNTNFITEFVRACMFHGIDNDPDKLMLYRNKVLDIYRNKPGQKEESDYAKKDKETGKIINEDYRNRFDNFTQTIYKKYPVYSDDGKETYEMTTIFGFPMSLNVSKVPTPPNYNAIREHLSKVPEYASQLENKGWDRDTAWGIATITFESNLRPSVLYGDTNILMYRPPDDTVPLSRDTRKEDFIARHVTFCQDICEEVNRDNGYIYIPGVKSLKYVNAPKVRGDVKVYSDVSNLDKVVVTTPPLISDNYKNPKFEVTYNDGTTEYITLFHEYDDQTDTYNLMLYSPTRDMKTYIRRADGRRLHVNYNNSKLIERMTRNFYKQEVIDFATACQDDNFLALVLGMSPKQAREHMKDVRKLIDSLSTKLGLSEEEIKHKLKMKGDK